MYQKSFWVFGNPYDNLNKSRYIPPSEVTLSVKMSALARRWISSSLHCTGLRDIKILVSIAGTVMGSPITTTEIEINPEIFRNRRSIYPGQHPEYADLYPVVAWYDPRSINQTLGIQYCGDSSIYCDIQCENGVLRLAQPFVLSPFNVNDTSDKFPLRNVISDSFYDVEGALESSDGPITGELGGGIRDGAARPYYDTFCS